MVTKSLEQIILTRRRRCCKCGKMMHRGEPCIKYTVDQKGTISFHSVKYWCEDCENRVGRILP
mgnify:CR=1 FL=1